LYSQGLFQGWDKDGIYNKDIIKGKKEARRHHFGDIKEVEKDIIRI